jgi:hypothetical protein
VTWDTVLTAVGAVGIWIALTRWVLPRLGIPT